MLSSASTGLYLVMTELITIAKSMYHLQIKYIYCTFAKHQSTKVFKIFKSFSKYLYLYLKHILDIVFVFAICI